MVLGSTQVRKGFSAGQALAMAAALARQSLHPVSRAIVTAANGDSACGSWAATAVVEVAGGGVSGEVTQVGAHTSVTHLRLGSASFCGVVAVRSDALQACLSDQNGWLATFELHEDVRPDASPTVASLSRAGIAVHLLSGDGTEAAARVATQVGVVEFRGNCSPNDKLVFLQKAQISGHKVAVVGDGLNDGPVLAGAHVSFAFGQAVPLAQARADFVVLGDQLGAVVQTLLLARRTVRVVRQNLWWAAIYNAACVPLAVVGWMPAWLAGLGMAASSLLVVLNSMRLSVPTGSNDGL
jgi:Cu2+-exporting ATPase